MPSTSCRGTTPTPTARSRRRRRVLRRHIRARPGPRPRGGPGQCRLPRRAVRTASGPFVVEAAWRSTRSVRPRRNAEGLLPLLRPIDAGLERCPITLTPRSAPVARGQFVRPTAGLSEPAELYRLRGPDGALVAIASRSGTTASRRTRCSSARRPPSRPRRAPDGRYAGRRRRRCPHAGPGPGVRRRRRLRRPPSRPPLPAPSDSWRRRPPARRVRPSSPSTTIPTRSSRAPRRRC